jgi:hypothetical protein
MVTPLLFVLIAGVQSHALPGDAPAPARAACAISGRITEQGSGRPIPRAIVRLVTPSEPLETVADDEGRYEFTGLDPGEYALTATPGELVATHLAQVYGEPGPLNFFESPRPNLVLKRGDVVRDANIALARALAIEGRVRDPWDEPMANVSVEVWHADGTAVDARPAETDDRGEFRVYGLAPGRYRVCAHPQSMWGRASDDELRFVRTCHLASTSEANAADVILDTEDAIGVDIRAQRSATYSASGSVLDSAGAPAEGATVGAMRDDHSTTAHATSRGGQFALTGLLPGRYAVWASVGGPEDPRDRRPPAREREVAYGMIDIDSSDASGITLSLSKPVTIAGHVRFEGGHEPPGRLHMIVDTRTSQDSPAWIERLPFAAVDDDLNFELAGVYRLPLIVGIHGLPDGWALRSVAFDRRDVTDVATDFGAGTAKRQLEIRLTNHIGRPRVRVTDDSGRPVISYMAFLLPVDPVRRKEAFWGGDVKPSRDGVLQLGARLPGDYLIAALPLSDYLLLMRDRSRIEDLASISRRVTLVEGDDQLLELTLTRLPRARQ